jgi:hypothetical protein
MLDQPLRDLFDTPELAAMDDAIANGALQVPSGSPEPLALFRAARVDYSLHRLYHYGWRSSAATALRATLKLLDGLARRDGARRGERNLKNAGRRIASMRRRSSGHDPVRQDVISTHR